MSTHADLKAKLQQVSSCPILYRHELNALVDHYDQLTRKYQAVVDHSEANDRRLAAADSRWQAIYEALDDTGIPYFTASGGIRELGLRLTIALAQIERLEGTVDRLSRPTPHEQITAQERAANQKLTSKFNALLVSLSVAVANATR